MTSQNDRLLLVAFCTGLTIGAAISVLILNRPVPAPEPPPTPRVAQKKADAPQNATSRQTEAIPGPTLEQWKQKNEAQDKEIKRLREFVAGKGLESVSQLEYRIDDAEEFDRMYRKVKALMLVVGIEVDAYGGVKFVEPLERK
mgnify:CR=1 FL=1